MHLHFVLNHSQAQPKRFKNCTNARPAHKSLPAAYLFNYSHFFPQTMLLHLSTFCVTFTHRVFLNVSLVDCFIFLVHCARGSRKWRTFICEDQANQNFPSINNDPRQAQRTTSPFYRNDTATSKNYTDLLSVLQTPRLSKLLFNNDAIL